jgi:TRAP-type uncharacterized transport system fused permease subunit
VARAASDGACLSGARHGGADDGGLCDLRFGGRAGAEKLGLEPLQAHLFVFWFALLSTITPPVCGAVFIAAGMIGENWLKVALTAMSLGVGLYVIPLTMVANPSIIALATEPMAAVIALAQIGLGLGLISYALIGRD